MLQTKTRTSDSARALDSLRQLVRALGASTRSSSPNGVSGAQIFALRQIAANPGISVNELAKRTMARQSTVSELVGRLVAEGLVLRRTDTDDARQAQLHLTSRGRKIVNNSATTVQEKLIAGVEKMPPKDRAALADALENWIVASGLESIVPSLFFEHPE
jgi:DNA-binding MarR family transcriptional regulator